MGRWIDSESFDEDRMLRLLDKIERKPGITLTELSRAANSLTGMQRQFYLDKLAEDGVIRIEKLPLSPSGRGRPKIRLWPAPKEKQPAPQPGKVPGKYRFAGELPSEQERKHWLTLLQTSDPERVDWHTIKRVFDQAYA
jgi:hypothetical protein